MLPCDEPFVIVDICLSDTDDLPIIKSAIMAHLKAPEDLVYDCLGAISEAVANALTHGQRDGTPYCRLAVHRLPGQVRILVEDRGNGFNWTGLCASMPAPDVDHGRGVHLIRELTDKVAIRSTPDGTQVEMTKRLPPPNGQTTGTGRKPT